MNWNGVVAPVIDFVNSLISPMLKIVTACAGVYFIYLCVKLILSGGNKAKRSNAIKHLITAVVAYFLIFFMMNGLKSAMPMLQNWVNSQTDNMLDGTIDITVPSVSANADTNGQPADNDSGNDMNGNDTNSSETIGNETNSDINSDEPNIIENADISDGEGTEAAGSEENADVVIDAGESDTTNDTEENTEIGTDMSENN